MIRLIKHGDYSLIETSNLTKILFLDKKDIYAWVNAEGIGEILVSSRKQHKADYILAIGKYRLYKVESEQKLIDGWHLELSVGNGLWQGYLLFTGLPNDKKIKGRIEPTEEIITKARTLAQTLNPK